MKTLRLGAICLCLLVLGNTNGFAAITPDEALSKFVSGGMAYKEGRYNVAVDQYKSLVDGEQVSGPLYYNLGNSYFKKKNLARAILNYERAKKYIPRDSDLNFNNRYAHSKIDQKIVSENLGLLNRVIQNHMTLYTFDEVAIILFCIGLIIGVLYLISLYACWRPSTVRGIIGVLLFSFLLYGGGLMVKIQSERNLAIVLITTNTLFEPRGDSTVHFQLSEGMKARILKLEGNWVKVRRLDGKIGWIDRSILEEI